MITLWHLLKKVPDGVFYRKFQEVVKKETLRKETAAAEVLITVIYYGKFRSLPRLHYSTIENDIGNFQNSLLLRRNSTVTAMTQPTLPKPQLLKNFIRQSRGQVVNLPKVTKIPKRRWLCFCSHVHTCSSACALNLCTRISRAQGHSHIQSAAAQANICQRVIQPLAVAKPCCQPACGYRKAGLHNLLSRLMKLTNFLYNFGHRAILFFGDQDVAGGFK